MTLLSVPVIEMTGLRFSDEAALRAVAQRAGEAWRPPTSGNRSPSARPRSTSTILTTPARPHFAPVVWPGKPAELRPVWTAYFSVMQSLAADLMRMFVLALDLSKTFFDPACSSTERPAKHPPVSSGGHLLGKLVKQTTLGNGITNAAA